MEHMTLSGHADVFPMSIEAKRRLLDYLRVARAAVAADPDGDETVRDLETTIGDTLRGTLGDGVWSIDEATMTRILDATGPLQQDPDAAPARAARPVVQTTAVVPHAPWLARVQEGKWFGGLVLGLAIRTDLDLAWTRVVIFAVLLLTGGTAGIVYLVLLLFAPRIETVAEYRAMLAADRAQRAG